MLKYIQGRRGIEASSDNQEQPVVSTPSDFRDLPIAAALFSWWLTFIPKRIIEIGLKLLNKAKVFFSIDLMLKTLFQPWKKDEMDTSNLSLDAKIQVLMMNMVSRLVGAIMRTGVIIIGIFSFATIIISMLVSELIFIALPVISIGLIFWGLFK